MLFIFVCGIDLSEYISEKVEEHIEKKEEQKQDKEERRKQRQEYLAKQKKEMIAQRKKAQNNNKIYNEEIAAIQDIQNQKMEPEQIKINLNGRVVEDEEEDRKGIRNILKKKKAKENTSVVDVASSIMDEEIVEEENIQEDSNLFVQEEEQKQDKTKQVLQLQHTISVEEDNYIFPPMDILNEIEKPSLKGGTKYLTETASKLQKTLYSFGVSAKVENVTLGPAITRYELKPAEGVRVSKIANLADDIALNLAAETIRIEAPIPGKQAVRNRSTK